MQFYRTCQALRPSLKFKPVQSFDMNAKGLRIKWKDILRCQRPIVFRGLNQAHVLKNILSSSQAVKTYILPQLGGERDFIVPVEFGGTYMDTDTFSKVYVDLLSLLQIYMDDLEADAAGWPKPPDTIGPPRWYLAQTELYDVFPFLKAKSREKEQKEGKVYFDYETSFQAEPTSDALPLPDILVQNNIEGPERINLWLNGRKGSVTPCHQDPFNNLLMQMHGEKQVLLFHPDSKDGLYTAEGTVQKNTSTIKFESFSDDDLNAYPLLTSEETVVRPFEPVTLLAGDVLFIPKHFYHFVSTESTSCAINYWWVSSEARSC